MMDNEGLQIIRGHAKTLADKPGVYRMIGRDGDILYVGKARSLKKRVASYTHLQKLPARLQQMVTLTRSMEFVVTQTEAEALLLESNLIKKLKPRYNILLRDDKSFPYILLTGDHDFPMVTKHRGARKRSGKYFGPFAGAGDVNRTIGQLQRVFLLRNCSDHVFANRSRPCLQYHIKRCTAPCVDKVSKQDYAQQVAEAQEFLEGKSRNIQERLLKDMNAASEAMDYERAALLRDRIKALTSIQARQDINLEGMGDVDIFGFAEKEGQSCVQVFFFRAGRNYGNHSYFPAHDKSNNPSEILQAFLAQFYENKPVPRHIIASHDFAEKSLLESALSIKSNTKVQINVPQRGAKKRAALFAQKNAAAALERHISQRASEKKLLVKVAELFELEDVPGRIEIYDNSHISGTNMVGAMVVAGPDGFQTNAYRKFNIRQADSADDYGMMREVFQRRFKRALKSQSQDKKTDWPDLVLIDGGKGQLSAATEMLEDLGVLDMVTLVSIAKGKDRHAGREQFFMNGRPPFTLPPNDPVMHYLQRLRDEAHRFAIGAHRQRRAGQITGSPLDQIAGIGAKRKKALLHYFGSAKAVSQAAVEDLAKVEGISEVQARKIYNHFH